MDFWILKGKHTSQTLLTDFVILVIFLDLRHRKPAWFNSLLILSNFFSVLLFHQICLRLILVSGKTHEFLFSPSDTAYYITQHVYENWPEGLLLFVGPNTSFAFCQRKKPPAIASLNFCYQWGFFFNCQSLFSIRMQKPQLKKSTRLFRGIFLHKLFIYMFVNFSSHATSLDSSRNYNK